MPATMAAHSILALCRQRFTVGRIALEDGIRPATVNCAQTRASLSLLTAL
jgi:hypothetical protein